MKEIVTELIPAPQIIEIEPALGCNLRCLMCHVPHMKVKPVFLDIELLERQTRNLTGIHVIIGSEFEPTIHPNFDALLRLAVKRSWRVDLLTNGVNLDRYDPSLLRDVRFHVFNVSFDGASKESFEFSRRGASYEKVLTNTIRVAELVRNNGAYTGISATMMRSNLAETPSMVRKWNDHGFDVIRLHMAQVRAVQGPLFNQSLYPIYNQLKDVLDETAALVVRDKLRIGVAAGYYGSSLFEKPPGGKVLDATFSSSNSQHRHVPRVRQSIQLGHWPGMPVRCKSPFVYARIRWDGIIDLCQNSNFSVGSLYDNTFDEIWNGSLVRSVRDSIKSAPRICKECDYFNFCINYSELDIRDKKSHFSSGIVERVEVNRDMLSRQASQAKPRASLEDV